MPRTSQPSTSTLFLGCAALLIVVVAAGLVIVAVQVWSVREAATQSALRPTLPEASLTPTPLPATATPTSTPSPEAAEAATATFTYTAAVLPTATLTPSPVPTIPPTAPPTAFPTIAWPPGPRTPAFMLIPDSELVNSPAAIGFDITGFIAAQPGLLGSYTETVSRRQMRGADIVEFIATSTSVNPRLLLALLEYRAGWLSNPSPTELLYPLGHVNEERKGLFSQLMWAANQLNTAYYGLKTRGALKLRFPDNTELVYAPEITFGTAAVQHFLAQTAPDRERWLFDVSPEGFHATYRRLFGDPFQYAIEPLVPPDLRQPALQLPFSRGETWYFSAGPHGGWDRRGSAWGAVDFAPPRPPDALLQQGRCYVSPYFVTAMAPGLIVRSRDGAVVLDLDMDGDERTGWTILYLHIAVKDRVPVGVVVEAGSRIGHPSCEGFYLNSPGTHIHIARRYNGEWIAADCRDCLPGVAAPPFVMSGWTLRGLRNQVSMGWLEAGGETFQQSGSRIELRDPITW